MDCAMSRRSKLQNLARVENVFNAGRVDELRLAGRVRSRIGREFEKRESRRDVSGVDSDGLSAVEMNGVHENYFQKG